MTASVTLEQKRERDRLYMRKFRARKYSSLGKTPRAFELHGKNHTPEYVIWCAIKRRCNGQNYKDFKHYGGRGIKICDRWAKSFAAFYSDMGPRPSLDLSIDRIDVNGNYEPGNCKWATRLEQQQNKQNTYFVTYHGERMSFPDAWRASGSDVSQSTARARVLRGWSLEDAFEREVA